VVADHHLNTGGVGVLEHVGEGFLHDPVGRQVHPRRQRHAFALGLELDRQAGVADLREELVQAGQGRLRLQRWWLVGLADDAQQAAQLDQGLAAGVLDGAQHLLGRRVVLAEDAALGGCLDHDHAQAVGDHVVQLPRDPGALVSDRAARLGLLVVLEQGGAVLEGGGEFLAAAQHPAQDPGQGVQEPAVDIVGRDRAGQHGGCVDGQDGRGRQQAPDDGAPPVGVGGDRVDRQQEGQERVGGGPGWQGRTGHRTRPPWTP
jgi:hypothetical protein